MDSLLKEGSEENLYGVICAYQDVDNFITVEITSSGDYSFWKQTDGEWDILLDASRPSEAIKSGKETNHWQVDCADNSLSLTINGEYIASVQHVEIPAGDVGLIAETNAAIPVEVEFDNFVVAAP